MLIVKSRTSHKFLSLVSNPLLISINSPSPSPQTPPLIPPSASPRRSTASTRPPAGLADPWSSLRPGSPSTASRGTISTRSLCGTPGLTAPALQTSDLRTDIRTWSAWRPARSRAGRSWKLGRRGREDRLSQMWYRYIRRS